MTCKICGHEHGNEVVHPRQFHFHPDGKVMELPAPVVSMIEHKGRVYVATSEGVYVLNNGRLERVMFVEPIEGIAVKF